MTRPLRLGLFGAAPDTGNLGVSALCLSVLHAIARHAPDADVTVFDHGRGLRRDHLLTAGRAWPFTRCGAVNTRRIYKRESFWNIRLCARFAVGGNPAARRLLQADALFDLSGGDSFTDLYGEHRFQTIILPKQLALQLRRPLVLLPQTYGPFRGEITRRLAEELVRRTTLAYARDQRSYQLLRQLLGDSFDPHRHKVGVDVAFALPPVAPAEPLAPPLADWLNDTTVDVVGLNVSGLIYNGGAAAAQQYGFKADYTRCVRELVQRILAKSDVRLILVPHVNAPLDAEESDENACRRLLATLDPAAAQRVAILPTQADPRQIKWLIARLKWFCGTRMHATIAALSSGVPTASIAYSHKTLGVFESCGQGTHVADPRQLGADEVVEQVWRSFLARNATRENLAAHLPDIRAAAEQQLVDILDRCRELAGGAVPAELPA